MKKFLKSLTAIPTIVFVLAGCSFEDAGNKAAASLRLVVDGYDNTWCSKSSVIREAASESAISDCNLWIFDSGGNFLLHEYCLCRESEADVEKLFPVNGDVYHLYVVTNTGGKIPFMPESETAMLGLKIEFDYGKFNELGLPAAGQGSYAPGKSTAFHLKRLAAKYVISIKDATAGGTKPYGFRFSGPDGKVVCRNVAKTVSPFATSRAVAGEEYGNDVDVEFLSAEELGAIDSGSSVEKTLYLLENVWGEGTAENVESGLSCASYLEISGNGRIDADTEAAEGQAGYCWDKVTCRYIFGTGPEGKGETAVRRNTLNVFSLSVTNGILGHSDGWHVVPENLVFDGSMEFTPGGVLNVTDNDIAIFQAVPMDHWGRNDGIEYTLDLPESLPEMTVQYRKSQEDAWTRYERGGDGPVLCGPNQFLLRNFSPYEMKDFRDALVFRSTDGTAFSSMDLNVNNAKGEYDFLIDRGQGYQKLDRIVLSPEGLPYYDNVLHSSQIRFKGIRTPFCKEKYTVRCTTEEQPRWLWLESPAGDGVRTAEGSYDSMFLEDTGPGCRVLTDRNDDDTRFGTVTASFPSYLGQGDAVVSISQIGLNSSFSLGFLYYGGPEQALWNYRNTAERIWNEQYADEHKRKNWGNPSEYIFLGRRIEFGMMIDLKAKLKVTGYDGGMDVGVSYKVRTEISKRGYGGLYDFGWPSVIGPGEVTVSYDDVVNVWKWPLTKEAYLEVTGLDIRHYMDNETGVVVDGDEEGMFYLDYVDDCLRTILNGEVKLHYGHNGVFVHDFLTLTPHTDFSLKPQMDLNTIYNLYGDRNPGIYLELP